MHTYQPAVYILTNKRNGTLYIGVTSNLPKRIDEHKAGHGSEFTSIVPERPVLWAQG